MMRSWFVNTLVLALLAAVSVLVYVRVAPDPVALVHVVPPAGAGPGRPVEMAGGYLAVERFDLPPSALARRLGAVIGATARTRLLAGSPEAGLATYVTRSRVFAFPDYTTVRIEPDGAGSRVTLFGRLRYGRSDFGVNRARIRGWLEKLRDGEGGG